MNIDRQSKSEKNLQIQQDLLWKNIQNFNVNSASCTLNEGHQAGDNFPNIAIKWNKSIILTETGSNKTLTLTSLETISADSLKTKRFSEIKVLIGEDKKVKGVYLGFENKKPHEVIELNWWYVLEIVNEELISLTR